MRSTSDQRQQQHGAYQRGLETFSDCPLSGSSLLPFHLKEYVTVSCFRWPLRTGIMTARIQAIYQLLCGTTGQSSTIVDLNICIGKLKHKSYQLQVGMVRLVTGSLIDELIHKWPISERLSTSRSCWNVIWAIKGNSNVLDIFTKPQKGGK